MPPPDPTRKPVFVVSDGTGDTAEKVVRAGLRQFAGHLVHVRTFPHVTRADQLENLFRHSQRTHALVVTTLVRREMRTIASRLAAEFGVLHIDLLGPLLVQLEDFLETGSAGVPGLLHRADARYYQRIEAIEFTVRADDGKDPRMLRDADIILVGVSRTSKTPLSTFLAHKGYKVGNQPIVLDRPVPEQLFEVDPRRIMALSISPHALREIRRSRLEAMRMSTDTNYSDMDYILAELEYAERLFRGNRWPVVDVTNRAIEETAATVLRLLQEHGLVQPAGDVSQL